jgi:hypothetical protein
MYSFVQAHNLEIALTEIIAKGANTVKADEG